MQKMKKIKINENNDLTNKPTKKLSSTIKIIERI